MSILRKRLEYPSNKALADGDGGNDLPAYHRRYGCEEYCFSDAMIGEMFPPESRDLHVELDHKSAVQTLQMI